MNADDIVNQQESAANEEAFEFSQQEEGELSHYSQGQV
jgi:hypothetical protein